MNTELMKKWLEYFAENQEDIIKIIKNLNIDGLDLPNIKCKTMGGEVWWRDLANYNGWSVQQNSVTKHCRILDPDNYRIAWGGINAMMSLFERMEK